MAALSHDAATLATRPLRSEVFIPDRRGDYSGKLGEEVSLRTIEYLEGTPGRGNLTPRMIGSMSDAEREFFDAICSVDGVGVKKAIRSMVRPMPK